MPWKETCVMDERLAFVAEWLRGEWHTEFLPIERVNELLRGRDLIVPPCRESEESPSGALRTALALLVPLAVSDVSNFEEVDDAAAHLNAKDPTRLAEEIAALLRDKPRRQALQTAAAAWLEQHDWARTAERVRGMLRGAVAEQYVERRLAAVAENRTPR